MSLAISSIEELLGKDADSLLNHVCKTIPKEKLHLPSSSYVDDVWYHSDRNIRVLNNLQWMLEHGRLGGTGFFPFFLLTRELNTVPVHPLPKIRLTLIRKVLLNWPLRADVTL
jgi:hypothetical protein